MKLVIGFNHEVQQLLKRVERSKCIWLGFRLNRSMIHPAPIQTICFWLNGKFYGFRDFTTHFQSPHTNKYTRFLSHLNPQALPPQHYSSSFHIEFDFNTVILQRSCCWSSCAHLGIRLMDTENPALLRSWKKITDTDTLRWEAACSLVFRYISPTERMCDT